MSGSIWCPLCMSGPFSYKGLSIHKRTCSGSNPEAKEAGSAAALDISTNESHGGLVVPVGSQSLGQSIFDQLTADTPPHSPHIGEEQDGEQDEAFPIPHVDSPEGEESSDEREVLNSNVLEGDKIGVPTSIKDALFKEPENFNSKFLYNSVNKDDSIRFRGNMWERMTPREKSNLHLLKILKGRELSLFREVQEWRCDSDLVYGDKISPRNRPPTRKAAVENLQKTYGYENLMPKEINLLLPKTKIRVTLIVFPFGNMLLSLLTDPVAMQPENLNLHPENPFAPPVVGGSDGQYGDFNTGTVHKDAHARYCKGEKDILAEITLFIDKTHLDNKGKHTLEPVMFTTALFKRHFRNQHEAWRPLGFIPNLDLLAPHAKAEDKQQDYHFCLRIIFSELAAYQKLGGLFWTFAFGQQEVSCRLQIPVNCILGDTDGHDKLCARSVNRSGTVQGCLCRYCDVKFKNLGVPQHNQKTRLTKCTTIRKLRNNPTPLNCEKLKEQGYRSFHDGAVDLCFSDPVRGLHGCTPGELLHAFQLGLAERSIESCFGAKKLSQKKKSGNSRKRKHTGEAVVQEEEEKEEEVEEDEAGEEEEEEGQEEEEEEDDIIIDIYEEDGMGHSGQDEMPKISGVMDSVAEQVLSTHYVFNKDAKKRVDSLAKQLHRHLRWQSDKSLPRTSFPKGITKLTKMQGNERTGVLLVLLVILIMEHWAYWRIPRRNPRDAVALKPHQAGYLDFALGEERFNNTVKSIYLLLTFEALMKSDKIPVAVAKKVETFIPIFLDQVLRTFARQEGVGDSLVKNHLPSHFIEDVRRLGAGPNFDSGIGESLHKSAAKETGRRTNMNSDSFEHQTAQRYVENITIYRGCCDHPQFAPRSAPTRVDNGQASVSVRILTIGSDCLWDSGNRKRNSLPRWEDSHLKPQFLVDFVRNMLLPRLPNTDKVLVFAKTNIGGTNYASSPCHGSLRYSKQDWAFVNMGSESEPIPCQLLVALQVPEDPTADVVLSGTRINEAGTYFLAHACQSHLTDKGIPPYETDRSTGWNEGSLAHADQRLIHRMPKSREVTPGNWTVAKHGEEASCVLVDAKAVLGPCIAIPDLLSDNSENDFFILRSASDWHNLFLQEAKDNKK